MKTYDERSQSVLNKLDAIKTKRKKTKRIVSLSCLCLLVLTIGLVLFIPLKSPAPDVSMYADSPYYDLIQRINEATYHGPRYKNNFEKLMSSMERVTMDGGINKGEDVMPGSPMPEVDMGNANNGSYEEVTDNQVEGVIEADLIKRSDKYIYYLNESVLRVFTIEKEDSREVGAFALGMDGTATLPVYGQAEMFLSEDCTTVTLIYGCMGYEYKTSYVSILSLDVRDPANIRKNDEILITGSYNSARIVDGKLMMLTNFHVSYDKDFSNESTYLPQIGRYGEMHSILPENIVAPEELSSTQYTVVTMMDPKSLEVHDTAAFLSYSNAIYVSEDHIFASRGFRDSENNRAMTEISCLAYTGTTLDMKGSVTLKGSVKDQYSMDEHKGILRVVTSTSETVETNNGQTASARFRRNASLYCVNLVDFTIAAKVEDFAPEGERAESVRFDGDTAYVCTAEVITLTDPVYFFDLSDLNNITWKDTGTIDGYSSSLVNFGDGYLLGIGFNERRELKIEVYGETETAVESLCSYELAADFSQNYKSYWIDRQGGYVGLCVYEYNTGDTEYILLKFDGYQLHELVRTPVISGVDTLRSVMIDGYVYILAKEFKVVKVY